MSAILATATAAKSGSTVTATVNGTPTTVQVARDLAVASGDVLVVERIGSQWFAVARGFATAPTAVDNDAPPTPRPAVTSGRLAVSPVETRSYRPAGGWRGDVDDVLQGDYGGNHTGAAFYATKPRSLAGATVTAATVRVRRLPGGDHAAQATTLRLVTEAARPAGAPTLGASTAGPALAVGGELEFAVPLSWAQQLVDGTAGGLAVYDATGAPYVRLAGRGSWSPAFTLTIMWQRG
ncbi:hypothetical protein AB0H57_24510 [Micromonospora sp. NPDC050686]|uniref:hypothetical protein n=1 Tax=Micromonospora sp. NPDC050686 TaxID=3154631 RepID=UPI0033EEF60A